MPGFVIPQPIAQFPGGAGLPVLPAYSFREPREGECYIPASIQWDGSGTTYNANIAGLTTQPFSQIVMLDVDNTQCGAAVTFYFPDSGDTLVVPAESGGTFPVFTGALQMYVSAVGSLSTDITRFRVLNYRQEPIANPPPQFSNVATAVNLTAAGTTAVLPSTVSGTLTGYSLNFSGQASASAASSWVGTLKDHKTGNIIDEASAVAFTNGFPNVMLFNVSGIAVRFGGGIDFVITNAGSPWVAQVANLSLRYRTP